MVGDRDAGPPTSLAGRRSECAVLDGLLDRVRGGRSAVVVLRGEPGIGKTALLRYATDRAAGFTVARCVGVESEMELAYTGLHDLCVPMLSLLRGHLRTHAESSGTAPQGHPVWVVSCPATSRLVLIGALGSSGSKIAVCRQRLRPASER